MSAFNPAWRRAQSAAFDLHANSTARRTLGLDLWGVRREVYANANLSIVSRQACNARCPFCVQELRPASRGIVATRPVVEAGDADYFTALAAVLDALRPLAPSVSITGGEPSLDPRLPRLLALLAARGLRKRTMTSNGTGLRAAATRAAVLGAGLAHLNLSRAHPDDAANARLMRAADLPSAHELAALAADCRRHGIRPRLSCALVQGAVDDFAGVLAYLDFAAGLGVDNVVFRQLMQTGTVTAAADAVVRFAERRRVRLAPLLAALGDASGFTFVKQVMGYYYYVEVWHYRGIDVVFEAADLARLEAVRRAQPGLVHELVFHPDAHLYSTWQAGEGRLDAGRDPLLPAATVDGLAA